MDYYLATKRNKIESVVVRQKDLESVIQSEVCQKEKNKYCILTHTYEIQKNSTNEPIYRAGIETQMQSTDLRTQQGKERVGRTETVAMTYTLPCEKQTASENWLCDTASSTQRSVTTRGMGWDGRWDWGFRREGTYVQLRLVHGDVWQRPTQYCRATVLP